MDLLAATAAVSGSVTMFEGMVFVVQAWVPASNLKKVNEIAASYPSRIEKIEPSPGERVPTLMANTGAAALGEDLVKIYDTPSFQDWDPSSWVFFSFVIFYSMIFADAGYALTIIAILLYAKHKVKDPSPALARFFNLSLILSAGTLAWGLLTGGFYGLSGSNPVMGWITKIALIDTDISHEGVLGTMMQLSIFIGMGHITISLILKALRYAKSMKNYLLGITNAAWIVCIWAFYFWAATKDDPAAANIASVAGTVVLVTMVIVFLTSAPFTFNPLKWFFGGFMGIYNGVQFFADVLSYLRIFALGLSGTLIAQNFNNLAQMVWDGMGWIGIIPAALIFVAGHALNIALGIMGGVIHGLRLNFLEWYRWCFDGGGRPYKAFKNLLSEDKA